MERNKRRLQIPLEMGGGFPFFRNHPLLLKNPLLYGQYFLLEVGEYCQQERECIFCGEYYSHDHVIDFGISIPPGIKLKQMEEVIPNLNEILRKMANIRLRLCPICGQEN